MNFFFSFRSVYRSRVSSSLSFKIQMITQIVWQKQNKLVSSQSIVDCSKCCMFHRIRITSEKREKKREKNKKIWHGADTRWKMTIEADNVDKISDNTISNRNKEKAGEWENYLKFSYEIHFHVSNNKLTDFRFTFIHPGITNNWESHFVFTLNEDLIIYSDFDEIQSVCQSFFSLGFSVGVRCRYSKWIGIYSNERCMCVISKWPLGINRKIPAILLLLLLPHRS